MPLGTERVAVEPAAVGKIVTRCARLPLALALAIAAARAATRPGLPLAALAAEMHDAGSRLDTLDTGETLASIRTVFSWSYQCLSPAAQLFRMLGLHPGPDISLAAVASLTDQPATGVWPSLTELVRANLVVEYAAGRYTFHDLLRAYATDLAHTMDFEQQRLAAIGRIPDHYLHTACSAARLLDPVPLALPRAGVTPQQLSDHAQALDWFTVEHQVLLAAVAHAAAGGLDTHMWQLTWILRACFTPCPSPRPAGA